MAYREDYSRPEQGDLLVAPKVRARVAETRVEAKGPPAPARPRPASEPVANPVPIVEQPAPQEASQKPAKSRKRVVIAAVLVAALGFGGYEGYGWWTNGRFVVATDDAYVQADITLLSAKVSGYISAVLVENNQQVKAGDVIARIDEGDYRLAVQSA